jgi:hypothetical protein
VATTAFPVRSKAAAMPCEAPVTIATFRGCGGLMRPGTSRRSRRPIDGRLRRLGLSASFWSWFENVDINVLGFVIVALFVATWVIALVIWRLGRIEERWSAHLGNSGAVD